VAPVFGEILCPVSSAPVGVLRAAGNLVHGAADLPGRITGDAADGRLGATLEVTGRATDLVAVHAELLSLD
jgi:hypothetical protein